MENPEQTLPKIRLNMQNGGSGTPNMKNNDSDKIIYLTVMCKNIKQLTDLNIEEHMIHKSTINKEVLFGTIVVLDEEKDKNKFSGLVNLLAIKGDDDGTAEAKAWY